MRDMKPIEEELLHLAPSRAVFDTVTTYCGRSRLKDLVLIDPRTATDRELRYHYAHLFTCFHKTNSFCKICLPEEEEGLLLLFIQSVG